MYIIKTKSGNYRWVAISSTAYRDEDKEIVSTNALKNAVERAKQKKEFGPLRFWHEPEIDLGSVDYMEVTEDGKYLIESGLFNDNRIAERIKENMGKQEWQMSIGFRHPRSEPDTDNVFHNIEIFERSIVPAGKAANRYTQFIVN